jgi:hypothetical protein
MITVNGVALSTLGFLAQRRSEMMLGSRRPEILEIPGGVPIQAGSIIRPRPFFVEGILRGSTHAAVLASLDTLSSILQGESVIRLDDYPDREWVGSPEETSGLSMIAPEWSQRGGRLTLNWILPDPRARAQTETTRSGSGALVLGTAPSDVRVSVAAAASVTVRVRAGGAAGTILRELVWAGTSGAIVVDAATQTVTRNGLNAISGITAASEFPVADPAEGADYIEVPAGATVTYRRRWWS